VGGENDVKEDCAFYRKNPVVNCGALKKIDCDDCNFYKTQKQLDDEIQRSKARIAQIKKAAGAATPNSASQK
jgi:hypothetical protein